MERNKWHNRSNHPEERNRANRYQGTHIDENMYRGAYRFDNTSDHHNVSTWDGYGSTARHPDQRNDYNRNYNQDYNRDYNRNYNSYQERDRGYDHDNANTHSRYRDHDQPYRTSNRSNWNDQQRMPERANRSSQHQSVHQRIEDHDPYGAGNFNADYAPDHYGRGGGENYGNMAGSLSYGYDGTSTYDPDWNRYYDPQSGHRRSYHGYYTSRHPEQGQYKENASRNPSDHLSRNRYF
ncbi:hypothetical protein ACSX1A_08480 [Pontibacter sp. MBLB2868]|uniref:hypothetical protein n=1 Tax=Pontibacter sp. MBLB2868 TaxID=3451555 RepID=UPI003F754605